MERNESFQTEQLKEIAVHLAWGQLEIFGDDVDKVQVMASGDESTTEDLRIELKDGRLVVEQPQYGLSLNITESRWLQVCVRVPKSFKAVLDCNTISGLLSARKLLGSDIDLETVSGELRAVKVTADKLALKTVTGDVRGEELCSGAMSLRGVSGSISLDGLDVKTLRSNSISGEQTFNMCSGFERVDVTAVSGNVIITAPVDAMNVSLRSITGRVRTERVSITDGADVPAVRITGVSADLKLISIKE